MSTKQFIMEIGNRCAGLRVQREMLRQFGRLVELDVVKVPRQANKKRILTDCTLAMDRLDEAVKLINQMPEHLVEK